MTSRGAKLTVSLALPGLFAILGFESASAQYLECNTPVSSPDSLVVNQMAPTYPTSLDRADIIVYFHVVAQSDGTGGLSDAVIDSMYQVAAQDLEALAVYIISAGQDTGRCRR